jgi:cytochrome c556
MAESKAKPGIWSNRADFDAKMKDLVDRSATLAAVAKSGDAAKSKAAFMDTANACKACHDKYRED